MVFEIFLEFIMSYFLADCAFSFVTINKKVKQ